MARNLTTYYETYPAMGSTIKICLTASMSEMEANKLLRLLKRTILRFEKRCSRFLPSSELSRFNQKAGTKQGVSPEFLKVVSKARDIGLRTDGLYNPFILPVLQRVGYLHSIVNTYVNDTTIDYSDRALTPVTDLEIGDGWARIPYGTAIDLGGCGKGYIGDELADIVDTYDEVEGYWLSMGGDVVVRGIHENGQPIAIGIVDEQRGGIIGRVEPKRGERYAVATSTILKRQGIKNGKAWHHIIDPRIAQPAETNLHTVTICTSSLFEADVHATNCIIVGLDGVSKYLKRHRISDALLQPRDDSIVHFGDRITRQVDKAVN